MSVQFSPRSDWFAGVPISNAGNPRPPLALPVPTITVHYTGSPKIARASTQTAAEFMPLLQHAAINRQPNPASFEYNYVIPPRADGTSQVWEYAGTYQAAHSAGENAVAIGVLMCIGVDNHPSYAWYDKTKPTVWEPLTDQMVHAYCWLRDDYLRQVGAITAAVAQVQHRNMPGAATACPGNSVIARWADLLATDQPEPPEDDMAVTVFKTAADSLTIWATADGLTAHRLEESHAKARGIDVFNVPVMAAAETAKLVFHAGLPSASVK